MPKLTWIGKEKVVNHHNEVPYRVLQHRYGFNADNAGDTSFTGSGNMIVHGDNLEALKALLPEYEGKVKCIYIDPPYNTGNEGWIYNDNVNDPHIQKWLHDTFHDSGVTLDDLTRHDKWLCMMYPRLCLLQRLLSEDGAIFISIDDNEQAHLRMICDEIFGASNFIANIVWRRRKSQANLSKNIAPIHDFIICYVKSQETILNKILTDIDPSEYKNPDNDPRGSYKTMPCTNKGGAKYSITTPTGKIITDEWRFKQETYYSLLYDNRLVFPKNGEGKPRYKIFLSEKAKDGVIPNTWWDDDASNQEATIELKSIFDNKIFDTPKPTKLIVKILSLITDSNSIILDSFAGSGTTAHAVLNLNKKDGGNRKFILVEMEDYADNITAERVRRVMNGYADTEGTGGSFDYYELGETMFNADGSLNEAVGEDRIREYVYYTDTKQYLSRKREAKNPYLLDTWNGVGYYLYYEQGKETTLNYDKLSIIKEKAERYIVYADTCTLDKDYMTEHNITFRKIPRDIQKF